MTTINLRPWREERKAARQKEFLAHLGSAAVIAVLTVLAIGYYFDFQDERQQRRNRYLTQEMQVLDRMIAEIKELREKRARLMERLNAIHELQGNRPVIVRNFDELVRVLPDGINYSLLTRQQEKVTIEGLADDSLDVSRLMRNLNESLWFGEPNLSQVGSEQRRKTFNLSVQLTKPKAEEQ